MDEQKKIGYLIKELRQNSGMTQKDFADRLKTSQSAVARLESGSQNISLKELAKISQTLKHPLVNISENQSDDFIINGGKKLSGEIQTQPSKNGALQLLCNSLLNKGKTTLHNIPPVEEIKRMLEVFESIGVDFKWIKEMSVEIQTPKKFKLDNLNQDSAKKMRSILMLIGPMVHFEKEFRIPHSGGCQMGERTISAHRYGLEPFGVNIKTQIDNYLIKANKLKPAEVTMYESSDTGTTNVLRIASLIKGKTIIHFPTQNYMVEDAILCLQKMGVRITQTGPVELTVEGVDEINQNIEIYNSEDPIESMAFLSLAIAGNNDFKINRCPIEFLRLEILKLEKMGVEFDISKPYLAENNYTKLVDIRVKKIKNLVALSDKIHPLPYPGINVDNLPFFVPIATQAKGTTLVHDWMWENRAIYFTELNRLGSDIKLADPHRAYITGPTKLRGAEIVCPPALRPSVIILIAMLIAEGKSTLRNVYSIKRGYYNLPERLNNLGADIKVVSSP